MIDLDITVKKVTKNLQIEASILKMLNWFSENRRNIHRDTFTGEILDHLISISIKLFKEGSDTIFVKIYNFFSKIYIDIYGKEYLRFLEFFIQTKTYIQLVESVLTWSGNNHIEFQKIDILNQLMNGELYDEIIEVIFDKFDNKELDNEFMHRLLHQFRISNNEHLEDIHQKLLKIDPEYFNISEQVQSNWEKIRGEIELRDFSNILDIDYWKGEVKKIYELLEIKEIDAKSLSKLYEIELKEQVSKFAKDFLLQICRTSLIAQEEAIKILKSRFDLIVINKFYVSYYNNDIPNLEESRTEKNNQWISNWCYENIDKIDFNKAISYTKNGYRKNVMASYLYFFMMKFQLSFHFSKLLDMLSSITEWQVFEYVVSELSKQNKKVETKETILSNLKENIEVKPVLQNHIDFCSKNGFTVILPKCYSILLDYDSSHVINKDLKITAFSAIKELSDDNYRELMKVIYHIQDDFKWYIIDNFIEEGEIDLTLIFLTDVINDYPELDAYEASERLIKLQNLKGFEFFYQYTKKHKKWRNRYWRKSPFENLTNLELINPLINLIELYLTEDIKDADKYDSFLTNIQKGLNSLAIQSDASYKEINDEIVILVDKYGGKTNDEKISNLNFYLNNLKDEFYRNKQNDITLQNVLERFNEF